MRNRVESVSPLFVENIPEKIKSGDLYISEKFRIAAHLCCCGCGEEVITPLTPADWKVRTEGKTVSLYPSIGNWSFACRSHYWIKRNRVEWAAALSEEKINLVKLRDRLDKDKYIKSENTRKEFDHNKSAENSAVKNNEKGLMWVFIWEIKKWIRGW